MAREVVVLSAVRSAIGSFGGTLSVMEPADLGGIVMKAAIERAQVDPQTIEYITVGNCIPTESRYAYTPRVASIQAGCSMNSVAMQVNRLCGSGLQAIVTSAQQILLGDVDLAMGDTQAIDAMVAVLTDPFGVGHMGVTAENLAAKWGITREEQDAFALESQRRAARAIAEGRFKDQIVPVTIKSRKGEIVFDTDEHPKPNTTMESLAKLKPVFKKDGTVTAGNASGINDAASFLVLADAKQAEKAGAKPLARLVAYAVAGVPNDVMGEGPIPATQVALKKAGLTLDDIDVIESNEAFAVQALTVLKQCGFDPEKTNPNGGAIALGHPVGATGAILATKLIYELHRIQGRYGLVTMCIGGGQGITAIFERL
jgi:acetyl-CoA C-acetyltransferase